MISPLNEPGPEGAPVIPTKAGGLGALSPGMVVWVSATLDRTDRDLALGILLVVQPGEHRHEGGRQHAAERDHRGSEQDQPVVVELG